MEVRNERLGLSWFAYLHMFSRDATWRRSKVRGFSSFSLSSRGNTPMTNWRPIEEAPETGRPVLLWARLKTNPPGLNDFYLIVGFWHHSIEEWKVWPEHLAQGRNSRLVAMKSGHCASFAVSFPTQASYLRLSAVKTSHRTPLIVSSNALGSVPTSISKSMPTCCGMPADTHWRMPDTTLGQSRTGWATGAFNTRCDIPSLPRHGLRIFGANQSPANRPNFGAAIGVSVRLLPMPCARRCR